MNQLLFLCTGNYYRSRYAEILFNLRAQQTGLNWNAESRGIAIDLGINNKGPISIHTSKGLTRHGLKLEIEKVRYPLQLQEEELISAHHIIALYETEHKPLLAERFPSWPDRVSYWQAPDIEHQQLSVEATLAYIDVQLSILLNQLTSQ